MEEQTLIYKMFSIIRNSCGVLLRGDVSSLTTTNSTTAMADSFEKCSEPPPVKLVCDTANLGSHTSAFILYTYALTYYMCDTLFLLFSFFNKVYNVSQV